MTLEITDIQDAELPEGGGYAPASPSQTSVPLSMLSLSPDNVRSTEAEDPALPAMVASIRAHGVLQPLIVTPVDGKPGRYAVEAGGRRYRALRSLANDLEIGENYPVPVSVRSAGDNITEISLAENVIRAALKPHEEFTAFARMAREGMTADDIAAHFGVKPRRVAQLLRLGTLAAPIAAAFEAGEIGLDEAEAYAGTSDTALQLSAFEANSKMDSWQAGAHHIRRLIRGDSHEQLGKLRAVGLDAYLEKGGRFDADLFGDETDGRVLDPDILEVLFEAKRAEAARTLKEQLPQVELVEDMPYGTGERIFGEREPLAGKAKTQGAAIEKKIAAKQKALDKLCDDDGDLEDAADLEKANALEDERCDLEAELEALRETAPLTFEPVDGKIVSALQFSPHGATFHADSFWVVPENWEPGQEVDETSDGGEGAASSPAEPPPPPTSGPAFLKAEFGLSQDSIEVMKGQRRMILQAAMLSSSLMHSATDFLTFALVSGIYKISGHTYPQERGIEHDLQIDHYSMPEIRDQKGSEIAEKEKAALDAGWLELEHLHESFDAFCELSTEAKQAWQLWLATQILSRSLNADGYACDLHDALGTALAIDAKAIRTFWTPDAAFWGRLGKKHRLAALAEIDEELPEISKKLGKDELLERCVAIFSGDQGLLIKLLPEGRAAKATIAAKEWVPDYLRFPPLPEAKPAPKKKAAAKK